MLLNVITSSPENVSKHFCMIFHLESKVLKRTEYGQTHHQLTLIHFSSLELLLVNRTTSIRFYFHIRLYYHLPVYISLFIFCFWYILMTNSWNIRYRYHLVIALRAIFSLIFFFPRKIIIILLLLFTIKVFRFFAMCVNFDIYAWKIWWAHSLHVIWTFFFLHTLVLFFIARSLFFLFSSLFHWHSPTF